ncbi:MAG: hypothetical protein ACRD06_01830 [Terriglobia bacterium]
MLSARIAPVITQMPYCAQYFARRAPWILLPDRDDHQTNVGWAGMQH